MTAQLNNFDIVLFGATGDLAMRKLLPCLYQAHAAGLLHPEGRILGVSRSKLDTAGFLEKIHSDSKIHIKTHFSEEMWQSFVRRIQYLTVDVNNLSDFEQLAQTVKARTQTDNVVIYLSTAPKFFAPACEHLAKVGLNGSNVRIVLEKPLGTDLASSQQINADVAQYFQEQQIYRIDHYLGKETVQNILAMRFSNQMFEPVWNANYVDHVQITMAEDIGIGSRAGYYDGVGAARDVIQNHLLQLLALTAMEEPLSLDSKHLRAEKAKVLEAVRVDDLENSYALGQYAPGYQGGEHVNGFFDEKDIPADSRTETFAALKVSIDNRRWAGTPFYLRAGKRLGRRVTEIAVLFKKSADRLFGKETEVPAGQNAIVIRVQPNEGMTIRFAAKVPGTQMEIRDVNMDFGYGHSFTEESPEAYERLILDVLLGEPPLFPRHEEVELSWKILDPFEEYWEEHKIKPEPYESGSWGPRSAHQMLERDNRAWRRP